MAGALSPSVSAAGTQRGPESAREQAATYPREASWQVGLMQGHRPPARPPGAVLTLTTRGRAAVQNPSGDPGRDAHRGPRGSHGLPRPTASLNRGCRVHTLGHPAQGSQWLGTNWQGIQPGQVRIPVTAKSEHCRTTRPGRGGTGWPTRPGAGHPRRCDGHSGGPLTLPLPD